MNQTNIVPSLMLLSKSEQFFHLAALLHVYIYIYGIKMSTSIAVGAQDLPCFNALCIYFYDPY